MRSPTHSHALLPLAPALAVLAIVLVAGACGGGGSSSPSTPSAPAPIPPAAATLTVTISSTGADPRSLQVPMGGIVTFVNNDSRTHQIMSDPNPTHNDCPSINDISTLAPGQSRQTGSLMVAKACGYHDHMNPDNTTLQGVLLVAGATDPGTHY
jgi:plastocyanin